MNPTSVSSAQHPAGPPRVSLAFRVGVVGHRPNRLKNANADELAQRLREMLQTVQAAVIDHHRVPDNAKRYSASPPQLRALSPLAEGVDRIFASGALDAGYTLTAVLPFHREEYEHDFAPDKALVPGALDSFRELLARAETVFELDGTRGDESYAYQIAGEVVLNQSDLLVVVWDGERKNLRGGTEVILDAALGRGVPVAWIDAKAPHHWQLLTNQRQLRDRLGDEGETITLSDSSDRSALSAVVQRLLQFPEAPAATDHAHRLDNPNKGWKAYLRERQARWNPAIFWKWFRNILGKTSWLPLSSWAPPSMSVQPYEDAVTPDWPRHPDHPVARVIDQLRPYYAWPDKLADRYADGYRSAFVMAYLLAALAVACALAPSALDMPEHEAGEIIFAVLECLAILLIISVVVLGRKRDWHQRWLDYRLLAEIVRHQRLAAPLGGQRASPSVPAHLASYGDPATSWMGWYARSLERALGLPSAKVDRLYLERSLADIRALLIGQIGFHQTTAKRTTTIEHKLHMTELFLFGGTLVFCLLHIAGGIGSFHLRGAILTFFCGFFPVLGASLAGITNQGEFRRIGQQSRSMAERLQVQLNELESLAIRVAETEHDPEQWSADIANAATDSARMMVSEVLGWRVIFQDRPLKTT